MSYIDIVCGDVIDEWSIFKYTNLNRAEDGRACFKRAKEKRTMNEPNTLHHN
jgi:hypothetical protein